MYASSFEFYHWYFVMKVYNNADIPIQLLSVLLLRLKALFLLGGDDHESWIIWQGMFSKADDIKMHSMIMFLGYFARLALFSFYYRHSVRSFRRGEHSMKKRKKNWENEISYHAEADWHESTAAINFPIKKKRRLCHDYDTKF